MRELLKLVLESCCSWKTQVRAALSVPLTDAAHADVSAAASSDNMELRDAPASSGKSYSCTDDRPGYLTSNGLGSLEIGASHDD